MEEIILIIRRTTTYEGFFFQYIDINCQKQLLKRPLYRKFGFEYIDVNY